MGDVERKSISEEVEKYLYVQVMEFVGQYLQVWLNRQEIKQDLISGKTWQYNGVAERKNRFILAILMHLPMYFWAEVGNTGVHIKNRSKLTVHQKTPYEVWHEVCEMIWQYYLWVE